MAGLTQAVSAATTGIASQVLLNGEKDNAIDVVDDGDGNLTPPVDITYTLKVDLRGWDHSGPNFTLDRNVVISDTLPEQASWMTGSAEFITSPGISLVQTNPCPATVAAFADDAQVGRHCVDGNKLMVNVGRDNATNTTINVKAQLDSVTGLMQTGTTTIRDATPYRWRNVATFTHRNGATYNATRDVTVVVLPDTSGGINDSSVFNKTAKARPETVDPGETSTIDYTFKVFAGKGIDARVSRIVDYVDNNFFDLGDDAGRNDRGPAARARLAFTGAPVRATVIIALLLLGLGGITRELGRRRRAID